MLPTHVRTQPAARSRACVEPPVVVLPAGVVPVTVGCVMLHAEGDDFGPVGPDAARAWAERNDVPFLTGPEIADALGAQWGAADKA